MNQPSTKKSSRLLALVVIQVAVVIYSFAGVAGKLASANAFLSWPFILLYGLEMVCLGVYAILWQQIIKRFELSIAYVNRAMSIAWSLIWSATIFKERITVQNIIGILIVVCGAALVNTTGKQAEHV